MRVTRASGPAVTLTLAITMVLTVAGLVGIGTAAEAATPTCNNRVIKAGTGGTLVPNVGRAGLPSHGSNTGCLLRSGNRTGADASRSAVWWLQFDLNRCYGQALTLDGDFGPRTAAALKVAQRAAGIDRDGVYGPRTRSAIRWYTQVSGPHGVIAADCLSYGQLR